MDSKKYADLAHEANLQGKILKIDGDNYWFEDPEQSETVSVPPLEDRIAALEDGMLAMMLGGANV